MTIPFKAPIDKKLEEKLEIMKMYICSFNLKNAYLWCMACMIEGHSKDNWQLRDDRWQDFLVIHTEYYCEICKGTQSHSIKDYLFNMKNVNPKWCGICEDSTHNTIERSLNMKKFKIISQSVKHKLLNIINIMVEIKKNNNYNQHEGYNGWETYNNEVIDLVVEED